MNWTIYGFEIHERIPTQVLSAPVFLKKAFAVLLALAVLTALALAGALVTVVR